MAARVSTWRPLLAFPDQKALSAFGRVSGPLRGSDAQCFPGKHPGTGDFRDVRGQCGSRVTLVNYDCNVVNVHRGLCSCFKRCMGSGRVRLATRLKHQLGHHNFPGLGEQVCLVLRLRTFCVPRDDGHHRGMDIVRIGRGIEAPGELPDRSSVFIQKLPMRRGLRCIIRRSARRQDGCSPPAEPATVARYPAAHQVGAPVATAKANATAVMCQGRWRSLAMVARYTKAVEAGAAGKWL